MGTQPSPLNVSTFLAQVKNLVKAGSYQLVPRGKNLQALADHGLTRIENPKPKWKECPQMLKFSRG